MSKEVFLEISRMESLRSEIAEAYQGNKSQAELGNLALNILILRNELEEDKSAQAKKMLEDLKELERAIVSLYLLARMGGVKTPHVWMPSYWQFKGH